MKTIVDYTAADVARALQGIGLSAEATPTEITIYGLGFVERHGLIARFRVEDYQGDSAGPKGAAKRILRDLGENYL